MAASIPPSKSTYSCPSCLAAFEDSKQPCPGCGGALVPTEMLAGQTQAITPGTMVGEYRIEELLGEGTFGLVYRAKHPIIGREAAIKVLKPTFSSDPEMLGRFIEEARSANRIRHRGIIDIFGFGSLPDGRHYYVMEMLDGVTLDGYLARRGALDVSEALPLLRSIARAMDAAHAAGVVHRDLKPANVFLCVEEDQMPRPKILDFGIAKLLSADSATGATRAGTPLGTPHYMSPEQARGLAIDKSTDVYAFGVMVFEMLTGKMPFDGETGMDILLEHIGTPPPRPSELNPELSPSVNAPILQMLAKDPIARPSSLTVAVEDLARATGHAWALMGPRTASSSALGVTRVSSNPAPVGPNRPTDGSLEPISNVAVATTRFDRAVDSRRGGVSAKVKWGAGGAVAAALIAALAIKSGAAKDSPAPMPQTAAALAPAAETARAVEPSPAAVLPAPSAAEAPSAEAVAAEAPSTPPSSPQAAAAVAAEPQAQAPQATATARAVAPVPKPRTTPQRPARAGKGNEIDSNPY